MNIFCIKVSRDKAMKLDRASEGTPRTFKVGAMYEDFLWLWNFNMISREELNKINELAFPLEKLLVDE